MGLSGVFTTNLENAAALNVSTCTVVKSKLQFITIKKKIGGHSSILFINME